MTAIAFDTLKLARKLEAAGFPPRQAADTTQALAESLGEVSGLATKQDLEAMEVALRADISDLRSKLETDIGAFRSDVEHEITGLRSELKGDFASLRSEVKGDIAELRSELKGDMAGLRAEMRGEFNLHLRWIVGTIIATAALAVTAMKLLP